MRIRRYTQCILGIVLVLACLSACDQLVPAPKESPAAPKAENSVPPRTEQIANDKRRPIQRFVPLPEYPANPIIYSVPRPFLALDTMTGNLCRTWNYSWTNPSEAQKSLQDLPTCEDLYTAISGEER